MMSDRLVSRRQMLELAAAGGLSVSGVASAFAQSAPARRIEQMDPALDKIISTSESIRVLAEGYGGDRGQAEGPVWWKDDGGYLLFSDIDKARRIKYAPGQGVSVFRENTNRANGLTRDMQGRLVACEADAKRVTRFEPDGSVTVVAAAYHGKQFGRPNDVVVKSDGAIYFTGPQGGASGNPWEVSVPGVYRVSPDLGSMWLLTDDLLTPNGLAFSADESVLYIADSRRRHIRAFDLLPNGTLALQTDRVFVDLNGPEPGVPDGIKVDTAGNV